MSTAHPTYGGRSRVREHKRAKERNSSKRVKKPDHVACPTNAFQLAFSKSFIPLLITDRIGRCIEANENALKLLDLRRSALVRRMLDSLFTLPEAMTAKHFQAELASGSPIDAEVRLKRKEGTALCLRMRVDNLDDGLKLISLSRISDEVTTNRVSANVSGPTGLLEEYFPIPRGDGETDYRSLFQYSPYGICILQNDRIAVVNPTFCKLLGYRSGEELIGKEIRAFLDEGSRMFFQLLQHRVFRGEAVPTRFETRMIRQGGSTIDVETSFALIWYKGSPALNFSLNDITDRKELEKRLIDSESLLRNVINSMVDALVITDLHGKVLDVNDEFQRFTGFSRREAFGAKIPYPWVPEEDLRSYIGWLEKLREHNVLRDFDITWLRKSGERIAVSLNTTLLRNASGEPVLMVNIARDISERQASRKELSRQLQRLQVLYDFSSALTESLDTEEIARTTFHQIEKVIPVDAFFIDLYDQERNEVRPIYSATVADGKSVEGPLRSGPIALDKSTTMARVIASRKPILESRDVSLQRPSSAPVAADRAASLMTVPIVSKKRIIGVLSVHSSKAKVYSNDHLTLLQSIAHLTGIAIEKAQLYQETIRKSREIEARNKELDDFTYVVSHDLKEPLISVEGYAKMMRHEYQEVLDAGGQEYLQAIFDSCVHMKRLIDDLLLLSRISKLAEKRARVDLSKLIKDVLEELQFSIRERKAAIVVPDNLPEVLAVDTHLRIVFRNLLANALKFCDKPIPRIEIGVNTCPEATIVSVRDNGIGIEPAHFDKIFLIFQRVHRKDEYGGVGAGLTIVKKIIESQGGKIWVESTLGEGSTFYFTIPTV